MSRKVAEEAVPVNFDMEEAAIRLELWARYATAEGWPTVNISDDYCSMAVSSTPYRKGAKPWAVVTISFFEAEDYSVCMCASLLGGDGTELNRIKSARTTAQVRLLLDALPTAGRVPKNERLRMCSFAPA